MMRTEEPRPVRLSEYRPPDWLVETVDLDVKLHPTQTPVRATLKLKPNPGGGRARPAGARRRRADARFAQDRRRAGRQGRLCRDAGRPHHRAAAAPAVHAGDRNAGRSAGQHAALGALPVERQLLHPVRGRGLPPHHLLSRPPGRDGGLHHAHRGRQGRSAGAARQRQSARDAATSPAAGISRSGTIPGRSPPICSRWSAASSATSRTASSPCPAARSRSASMSSPARRTAPATPWIRSSARCAGTRRRSAANTTSTSS